MRYAVPGAGMSGDPVTVAVSDLRAARLLPERGWGPPGGPRVGRLLRYRGGKQIDLRLEVAPIPGGNRLTLRFLPAGQQIELTRQPRTGRWYFACLICHRPAGVLVLVDDGFEELPQPPVGDPLRSSLWRWGCRHCAGVRPAAWALSPRERVLRALERSKDADRQRPGEKRQRWMRRLRRAEDARKQAAAITQAAVERARAWLE